MSIKLIISVVLASLAVIFVVQNVAPVEVSFFIWTFAMSRALVIFFSIAAGLILGWTLHAILSFRKSRSDVPGDKAPPAQTPPAT